MLAKAMGSTLRLIHAVNDSLFDTGYGPAVDAGYVVAAFREAGTKIIEDARSIVRAEGLEAQVVLPETVGRPAFLILEEARAWPADLIVMGTHGRQRR